MQGETDQGMYTIILKGGKLTNCRSAMKLSQHAIIALDPDEIATAQHPGKLGPPFIWKTYTQAAKRSVLGGLGPTA